MSPPSGACTFFCERWRGDHFGRWFWGGPFVVPCLLFHVHTLELLGLPRFCQQDRERPRLRPINQERPKKVRAPRSPYRGCLGAQFGRALFLYVHDSAPLAIPYAVALKEGGGPRYDTRAMDTNRARARSPLLGWPDCVCIGLNLTQRAPLRRPKGMLHHPAG